MGRTRAMSPVRLTLDADYFVPPKVAARGAFIPTAVRQDIEASNALYGGLTPALGFRGASHHLVGPLSGTPVVLVPESGKSEFGQRQPSQR
jgi:hypothetical protein